MTTEKLPFDRHVYYEEAVQYPPADIEFIQKTYFELRQKQPHLLREDFGGTGLLASLWVQEDAQNTAYVVDNDDDPLNYGQAHHKPKLSPEEQKRLHYCKKDVLTATDLKTDVVVAFNFSYMIFKERQKLLHYFKTVRESLCAQGVFYLDILGGPDCMMETEDETEFDDFTYYWDCLDFNIINHEVKFAIHFKQNNHKKIYKNVFTYDWRLWSIPELTDLLKEAGFKDVHTYWEGDDGDGEGNGEFTLSRHAENSESWIAYLVATN